MSLRIKELRKSRGWAQQDLASRAGLSRSYLSELETGSKPINVPRLSRIADVLGVELIELFDLSEISPTFERLLKVYSALPDDRRMQWVEIAEAVGKALIPDGYDREVDRNRG